MKTKMFALLALLLSAGHAQGATVYGAQATKYQNSSIPGQVLQGDERGHVKHCRDSFALTGDLSQSDLIKLCKIPSGARVIDVRLIFPALSAGMLDVGWSTLSGVSGSEGASTAGFMNRVAVTSAGVASMFTSYSTSPGFMKLFAGEVQSVIYVNYDTTATSGSIILEVLYVID